jgi:hypothetical protein
MELSNRPNNLVIIRGWRDEPSRLVAFGTALGGQLVLVGSPDGRRRIGLPVDQVFHYEDSLFHRLIQAFEMRESEELLRLYASCNIYQNIVDSQHGQEHVPDPCGAPGGIQQ